MTIMEFRRVSLGLSARELARRVGVSVVSLRAIERRQTANPSAEIAEAIGLELRLPTETLLWELAPGDREREAREAEREAKRAAAHHAAVEAAEALVATLTQARERLDREIAPQNENGAR